MSPETTPIYCSTNRQHFTVHLRWRAQVVLFSNVSQDASNPLRLASGMAAFHHQWLFVGELRSSRWIFAPLSLIPGKTYFCASYPWENLRETASRYVLHVPFDFCTLEPKVEKIQATTDNHKTQGCISLGTFEEHLHIWHLLSNCRHQ